MALHIDFETQSAVDLGREGLDRYASSPSTSVLCMGFAFDDEPVCIWTDGYAEGFLKQVESGALVYAHNAAFELAIWNCIMVPRYRWPVLKPEQVRCTLAMTYAMGLPGSLEAAAPALGLDMKKDMQGRRIMLKWCKPKADGSFWRPADDPLGFKKLCDYCKQDVEVERAMSKRLLELSPKEQDIWQLDYRVNQRGIQVDLKSATKAVQIVEAEKTRLDLSIRKATDGYVSAASEVKRITTWAETQGVELGGLGKADVVEALALADLPPVVRDVLTLRQLASKTSTSKFQAMLDRVGPGGRIRGMHQYHGAGTGRWAGRGVQVHNLARTRKEVGVKGVEWILANLDKPAAIEIMYSPTLTALSDCLRGMLIAPPGGMLACYDFSAIEARVLAWLSGADNVLNVFRNGADIYLAAASAIYRVPISQVTSSQRQVGKVAVLALGYGGGVGAFQMMAKTYGVKVPDAEAEDIKTNWRRAHPAVTKFWYDLESSAITAVLDGGIQTVRGISFKKSGSFLWCRLPSGRSLCYPYPEIRVVTTSWGEDKDALTFMSVVDQNKKNKILSDPQNSGTWGRISTYGGSLAENVTQATARDILAEAMLRMDAEGLRIVMHVHDEVVVELSEADAAKAGRIKEIMSQPPTWAPGLPLAAEGWIGERYRK